MSGTLKTIPVSCAFEFAFHGGLTGYAVGEKFTAPPMRHLKTKAPLFALPPPVVRVCRKRLSSYADGQD